MDYDRAPYYVRIVKFVCDICGRKWNSASGNLEDYQICKNCYRECYPVNYKFEAPNKRGNQNRETYESHKSELCGKCTRLGRSCMEIGQGNGMTVLNDEGEEIILRDRNLSSFMYIDNSISNTRLANVANMNKSIIDVTKQDDEFPPLANIHIDHGNEKEGPSSLGGSSNDCYQNVHPNSNSASDDYIYCTEDDQSEGTEHEEDDQESEDSWYVEEPQIVSISRYMGDDQVNYIIYGENDDGQSDCVDYHSFVEDFDTFDIYDEDNEDGQSLLEDGDSCEDFPVEEWTYEEWESMYGCENESCIMTDDLLFWFS